MPFFRTRSFHRFPTRRRVLATGAAALALPMLPALAQSPRVKLRVLLPRLRCFL